MDKIGYKYLPNPDKTLLDGILDEVPNYMEEYQSIEGSTDLDDILYRHVKEIVYNHTTCFLCTNVRNNLIVKDNIIVREAVTDDSPSGKKGVGVMIIEKNPSPRP